MDITERYRRWRRYRTMVRELQSYTHRELSDLGIARQDIEQIFNELLAALPDGEADPARHAVEEARRAELAAIRGR